MTVLLGWSLSFACLLSLLYGLYGAVLDPITAAAYSSLSHSAWAISLAWIVIACSCGYGGTYHLRCMSLGTSLRDRQVEPNVPPTLAP